MVKVLVFASNNEVLYEILAELNDDNLAVISSLSGFDETTFKESVSAIKKDFLVPVSEESMTQMKFLSHVSDRFVFLRILTTLLNNVAPGSQQYLKNLSPISNST